MKALALLDILVSHCIVSEGSLKGFFMIFYIVIFDKVIAIQNKVASWFCSGNNSLNSGTLLDIMRI